MRRTITILFLLNFTLSYGQVTDKAFVDRWLKLCDEKIQVDSVRAYYIDREYFTDTAKINARRQPGQAVGLYLRRGSVDQELD